jgi:broad specificity phosphatase PhoE
MQIILARHGDPMFQHESWIAPRQLAEWIGAYDGAGIVAEDPPRKACAKAAESSLIVSSTAPRCFESARAVAPRREILREDSLREAGLPFARWDSPRLPPPVWTALFRLCWFCGYSSNSESFVAATSRARSAAATLIELAQAHQAVFVMGHGIMNVIIARVLLRHGWIGPRWPAQGHWQFSVYRNGAP